MNTSLSDAIIEHLSPFALDEEKIAKPFYLNVNVSDSNVLIKVKVAQSGTPSF